LIYKLDPADGSVLDTLDSPSRGQQGLTFDGQFLWSTGGGNIVYQIDVGFGLVRDLDIKPFSDTNPINPTGTGMIPVAIL
jgi:hypothetical protein